MEPSNEIRRLMEPDRDGPDSARGKAMGAILSDSPFLMLVKRGGDVVAHRDGISAIEAIGMLEAIKMVILKSVE